MDVILSNPEVRLDPRGELGHLETRFLSTITTIEELEPKANGCTEVSQQYTCMCTFVAACHTLKAKQSIFCCVVSYNSLCIIVVIAIHSY